MADTVILSPRMVKIKHKVANTVKEMEYLDWLAVRHNWRNWEQVGEPYSQSLKPAEPPVTIAEKVPEETPQQEMAKDSTKEKDKKEK